MIIKLKTKWQKLSLTGRLLLTTVLLFVGILIANAAPLKATDGIGLQGDTLEIVDQVNRTPHVRWTRSVSGGGNVEQDMLTGRQVLRPVVAFISLDATPSVKFGNNFKTANAGATTITALDDCSDGQEVKLIVNDANTAITDGGLLHMAGNVAAGAGTVEDTITFVCTTSGHAYETARSVN